jgi:Ca2+-binding EF-hand superfamily protein
LVFGVIGNEKWKPREKDRIFQQHRGTMEEIQKFVEVWSQLDEDGSGDIDFGEFVDYFANSTVDRLLCVRCVKYLLAKAGRGADVERFLRRQDSATSPRNSRKATIAKCTREDMMKLLWLQARDEDVRAMNMMFDLNRIQRARVPDPPRLPRKKKRQLLENFNFLDKHQQGFITFNDLVEADLVDDSMQHELQLKYDRSGKGILEADLFLEMLCPYGFQAHDRVKRITMEDDRVVHKVCVDCRDLPCSYDQMVGWIPEDDLKTFKDDGNSLLASYVFPENSKLP